MANQDTQPKKLRTYDHPFLIRLAMVIGKVLPRKLGLKLATQIGTLMGKNKGSPMVSAIRANQWVIHNQSLDPDTLEKLPQIVFQSSVKCFFDYFYFLSRPSKLKRIVEISPEAMEAFKRIWEKKPCVVVCPHTSNFDLMGYVLTLYDLDVQVLSFPNPNASYKLQNQLRESLGIFVTPMNLNAFRQARKRLKDGGSILTGLDRPLDKAQDHKYQSTFFGFESNLPISYVRMAKEAGAPVFIMAAASQPDGKYRLEGSQPIWMEAGESLKEEISMNAQRVLAVAEPIIKQYADQWAMFYPVWPKFLGV
jgi:KDO2-lipid IV(A) lauroyltransferase